METDEQRAIFNMVLLLKQRTERMNPSKKKKKFQDLKPILKEEAFGHADTEHRNSTESLQQLLAMPNRYRRRPSILQEMQGLNEEEI